ncbi:hypothetical protein ONE63_003050 [Megalurothrips usitatus]|uniref:DBB domain-containing protein n=1 Tax=Megalurothrips usitatus TaxID=439358 RepID=A0AAV7X8L9_9NEOP|nr:hypothetical protein ONE63_003050 [Megalurothrips usitatus]
MWITYLQSCFVEICRKRGRPSFRTSDVGVEELAGERWRRRLEQAKLVVLVVCPAMLARVAAATAALAGVMARLESERVLLMLLGVHEYELQPEHRAVLGGDCRRMAVRDQDATFVGEFLAVAMDILVRAWRARAARERRTADGGGALFSLAPKKVKQGMGKVLALLVSPLQPGDDPLVCVHRDGADPVPVPPRLRNPYTIQFAVPEALLDVSAMITVSVWVNGQPLGSRQLKCESRLRELDRILRARDNPLQFLCQTLGFGPCDREALDNSLLTSYLRNVPPHFNLLQSQGGRPSYMPPPGCEQYPTLLHFAAHLGLARLAMALLEGPGGEQACYIRNCDDLTAAEMGERSGHTRLACALQGYMQMSELSNVYSILKSMNDADSEAGGGGSGEDGNYLSPRPASETYSVPPPPAQLASLYQNMAGWPRGAPSEVEAAAQPLAAGRDEVGALYLNVDPAGLPCGAGSPGDEDAAMPEYEPEPNAGWASEGEDEVDGGGRCLRRDSDPGGAAEAPDDDDLMDIIHDLKSSSFSLGEVEHLVHSWRGRNATHQSFQDKQVGPTARWEELTRMREELERVERRLVGEAGPARPSPLQRIKRVFARAKGGKSAKARGKAAERVEAASASASAGTSPVAAVPPPAASSPSSSLSRRSSSSSTCTWSERSGAVTEQPAPRTVQVDAVSWLHPVSPAAAAAADYSEHYVSPVGVRPVSVPAAASSSAASASALTLADDGFPLDPSGFSSYVNVKLPSWPPPVPARASSASCSAPSSTPSSSPPWSALAE